MNCHFKRASCIWNKMNCQFKWNRLSTFILPSFSILFRNFSSNWIAFAPPYFFHTTINFLYVMMSLRRIKNLTKTITLSSLFVWSVRSCWHSLSIISSKSFPHEPTLKSILALRKLLWSVLNSSSYINRKAKVSESVGLESAMKKKIIQS